MSVLHLPATSAAATAAPTMSSREIADLVESRHDSVKRTMERLAEKGVIRFTPSVETSHEGAGAREVEVYLVNKRDSYVVVAQLSPEFTARLVDRWQELEEGGGRTLPKSFADALQLAAEQARQIDQQNALIVEQQPKVEAFDKFMKAKGAFGYQNAARVLGCRPNLFVKWLKEEYLFYRGSALVPYAEFVERGMFIVRTTTGTDDKVHERGFITPKGLNHLSTRFPRHLLSAAPADSAAAATADLIQHLSAKDRTLS